MYAEDLRRAQATFGLILTQIYGLGETPMTVTYLPLSVLAQEGQQLASVGRAHPNVDLRLLDEAGTDVPIGAIGEVCVRSGAVMLGYWNDAEATQEILKGGWLHTGDLGRLDELGYLYLLDRKKDLIVSGGSNIYPREVEEVLLAHPGVAEASVVGCPDREWGEIVVAFVVARGEPPPVAELDRLCLDHIARFKRPKEYRFVEMLPKNHYGKVVKTELRAALAHE